MATATFNTAPSETRRGVSMETTKTETTNRLRPELEKIVEEIIGLKALTSTTGYMTFKEQRTILERLSTPDRAAVGRELAKREQKQ